MKQFYLHKGWGALALLATLGVAGCSKSDSKSEDPEPRVTLVINSTLSGGTNTMFYTELSSKAGGETFVSRSGGNFDFDGVVTEEEPNRPLGQYRFRLTCPSVVRGEIDPAYPPQGKGTAELVYKGRTLAKLELDLSRPVFENDTCRQTAIVEVK